MRKQSRPSADMVALSSGILVPRAFHDERFMNVAAHVPTLKYGTRYKAKDMVVPSLYAKWDYQDRWRLGCCVADWERHRKIRVRFLGCPHCSVRYYERI